MRLVALVSLSVLLAACSVRGDGGGATVEQSELAQTVLQPADLPRVFMRFDEGPQGLADSRGGRREEVDRFGREGGWKARYRRSGTTQTKGALVVASLVDVFDSVGGAEEEYDALQGDLAAGELGWQDVEAPQIGDESAARTVVQGSGPTGVRFFLIAWRVDNAVATLEANGFDKRMTLAEALALARKQQTRLAAAAS